jgi:tape measure domain-containing protein
MTTTTQINITAKDQTAGAFSSASKNLSELASSALKTTAGLAGIGLSIAGAVEAVKGIAQATIQFQQFTSTLQVGTGSAKGAADAIAFVRSESQRLGLDLATAADQFGKLSAASKGTTLEGKATRDIFSSVAAAATAMGLSADQTSGSLLAIQQMISKGTVSAEELRGQLGERLPGAFQLAARAIGVTTSELDKLLRSGSITAEQLLPALSKELNKTFGAQSEQAAQGLTAQMNRMNTAIFDLKIAIGESGLINFLSSGIELATKLSNALTSAFGGGQKLSPVEKQVSLIRTLEGELESLQNLTHIPLIGDLLFDKKQADLLKFRIESATEDLQKMKASLASEATKDTVISEAAKDAGVLSVATKATISDAERFIASLGKEADAVGLTATEIKRLEAAKLGVLSVASPLIDKIDSVTAEMTAQKDASRALASDLAKIKSITESVRTEEEKLVDTQSELNRLMGSGLSQETYTRAMEKARKETTSVGKETKQVTDQVDQLWTQAGRNIQSTLANSIFNFFDDGLKGMLKNVISTVGRIASEFAALKLAQNIGLAGIFGGSSGAALASGGGGLMTGLNLASSGASLAGLFKSGFGATSLLSSAGSSLPGVAGSFFAGMGTTGTQAAAQAGASTLWGASGATGAASMGASFAAMAGPAIAIAAVDQITRMLVGDKRLGGTAGKVLDFVPILGPLINGLFGRGPMKQGMTSLKGSIGSEGFESGALQTRFDAKGGVFSSTKTDFATVDAVTGKVTTDNGKLNAYASDLAKTATGIIGLINDTTKQVSSSLYQIGDNLGLSTEGLDNFSHTLKLVSAAGKGLTEEQVGSEIAKITDELARSLLPNIDEFANRGESASQALIRLNTEFDTLEKSVTDLGYSAGFAKDLIIGMSIDARSAFLEMAGGADNLKSLTGYFAENYLTTTEKIAPLITFLTDEVAKLGLTYSTDITKDQVKSFIQSGDVSAELKVGVLKLLPTFDIVRNALDSMSSTTDKAAGDIADFSTDVSGIKSELLASYKNERGVIESTISSFKNQLLASYKNERGVIESTISSFKNLATQLRGFREGLSLGALSPLTPSQRLDEARNQFNQTRTAAAAGDQNALAKLPSIAQDFLTASQTYNASGSAYISDFGMVQSVLLNAENSALSQIDIATSQLSALDKSVDNLIDIKDSTKTTVDLIRELNIAVLTGAGLDKSVDNLIDIKDSTKTTVDLIRELNIAVLTGAGNQAITNQMLADYLKMNPGVSTGQVISGATGLGVSISQLGAAGYDTAAINKALGGATLSDKQILDAVNSGASVMEIYNAAVANGVSSSRLASVTGWSVTDILQWTKDNGVPAFAKGTDFISKSGLAMVHRAEAIVPSSTTDEIKKLREELAKLREEQNRQTGDMINVADITSRQNAQVIAKAMAEAERSRQWNNRSKVNLA